VLVPGEMFSGAREYKESIRELKITVYMNTAGTNFEQDTKSPKTQLLLLRCPSKSRVLQYDPCIQQNQGGGQITRATPPAQTLDPPLPSFPLGHQLAHVQEASKGTCYLFLLPAALVPVKPCLNVLSGLLSISID